MQKRIKTMPKHAYGSILTRIVRLSALILCLICTAAVLYTGNVSSHAEENGINTEAPATESPSDPTFTAPPGGIGGNGTDFTTDEMQQAMQFLLENDIPYILCDAEKGQVLLSKDSGEPVNASLLARMMTCLIALENHNLSDKIRATLTTVSKDGKFTLTVGESYTVGELVNTALIGNADNAVRLLAENTELSNTEADSFIAYMNERALRLGMNDTYFTSPDGAENPLQKTTVYDTAVFLRYALNNSRFKSIYCSPYFVSWRGIVINNPNPIAVVHTAATVGGSFGFFDNTGDFGTSTYYIQRDSESELKSSRILLIVSGLNTDDLALMQNALLHEFRNTWEKILYVKKDTAVNTVTLGEGKLSMEIGSNVYFYVPVLDPEYVETISFSYLDNMSPETIRPPINRGDNLGTVRYRLKSGTTIEVPLYAGNTILSERRAVNNFIELMSSYIEIFWGMGFLFVAAAAIALYKIIFHIYRRG